MPSKTSSGHLSKPSDAHKYSLRRSELREQRIDELLDSCRDQVLQQIIGPFGLSPAMFDDKAGGNVTTQHNAERDIFANPDERYDPQDYKGRSYRVARERKMADESGPQGVKNVYTGKITSRPDLDHLISMKQAHQMGGWQKDSTKRSEIGADTRNLNFTDQSLNRSKSDKEMGEWLKNGNKERFGIDGRRIRHRQERADAAISSHMPDLKERIQYDAKALAQTGMDSAARNAFRQATGMLLHELVNGSYLEVKRIAKEPSLQENFVDHLIEALRNVAERIKGKLDHIFKNVIDGGVQGFVSNLLTYIINSIVTTSAKVVTVIREGLKGLWDAIKLISNPPPGLSGAEIARQATKIIAAVITTSLGLIFEKSVETFVLSIPILAPLSGVLTPAITAILTGIVTALVIFGIDKFFDWLSESGTEMLTARIENMEASRELFEHMAQMLQSQFDNSGQYHMCIEQYRLIEADLSRSEANIDKAVESAERAALIRAATISTMMSELSECKDLDGEVDDLFEQFENRKKGE